MRESIATCYRALVDMGELAPDIAQERAVARLQALAAHLHSVRPRRNVLSRTIVPPQGAYLWGDVGRGKSMLMDMFFTVAAIRPRRRVHFNAFMMETHARIHRARRQDLGDPILQVAKIVAAESALLCLDEFQVTDVADAMILGRLFEQLFTTGGTIIATSNTAPSELYRGGLNRQLFLPFIALVEGRLEIVELNGPTDFRLQRLTDVGTYVTPLGPAADAKMDAAWRRLTDRSRGDPLLLTVLGHKLLVPQCAKGVARFRFSELCRNALAASDYLEIARHFHTVLIDDVPAMGAAERNEARRFTLLIDTLYDQNVKLVCSAAVPPEALYTCGDGVVAFRRTASRLVEMQSTDYLHRGHGIRRLPIESTADEA